MVEAEVTPSTRALTLHLHRSLRATPVAWLCFSRQLPPISKVRLGCKISNQDYRDGNNTPTGDVQLNVPEGGDVSGASGQTGDQIGFFFIGEASETLIGGNLRFSGAPAGSILAGV